MVLAKETEKDKREIARNTLVSVTRKLIESPDENGYIVSCGGLEPIEVMTLWEFQEKVRKRKIRKKDYIVERVDCCLRHDESIE